MRQTRIPFLPTTNSLRGTLVLLGFVLMAGPSPADAAGRTYIYGFEAGQELRFRHVLRTVASMAMPDGQKQDMRMEATSVIRKEILSASGGKMEVQTRTLRTKAMMNGKPAPEAEVSSEPTRFTLLPDGRVEGGSGAGSFLVVFPPRELEVGDSWSHPFDGDGSEDGIPLVVTYTLVKVGVRVPEYDRLADVFTAKVSLGEGATDVKLRKGEGRFLFDPKSGIPLQNTLKIAYDDSSPLDLGEGLEPVTTKRSMGMGISFSLIPRQKP